MDSQEEGLPKGTILKEFPLNGGSLSLEATLNKSVSIVSRDRLRTRTGRQTHPQRTENALVCRFFSLSFRQTDRQTYGGTARKEKRFSFLQSARFPV